MNPPAGVGTVFAGEINSNNLIETNVILGGSIGIDSPLGDRPYAELPYAFYLIVVNVGYPGQTDPLHF